MKKFKDIVSKDKVSSFEATARNDMANRNWLDKSFEIALLILARLKELNWTQVQLADALKVSPQYVNKIVKGKENLTLETIAGIEGILNMKLISVDMYQYKTVSIKSTGVPFFFDKSNYRPIFSETKAIERKTFDTTINTNKNLEIAA
jgi:transcriptional regulator with XRE-family HTH domain